MCSACRYPVVPAAFVKNAILFLLDYLDTFVKNLLTVNIKVYFENLSSVSFIYIFIHIPVPHSFDYCNFRVSFEIE